MVGDLSWSIYRSSQLFRHLFCEAVPGHEVKLWVAQLHLGAPAANTSNAVPPFHVVTPAAYLFQFLPHNYSLLED